jgi:uncharacterized membrane protein YccC
MTDLVERLRSFHHTNSVYGAAQDAADRIESLEAALREIASGYPSPADARLGRLMQIARAALDKEAGK